MDKIKFISISTSRNLSILAGVATIIGCHSQPEPVPIVIRPELTIKPPELPKSDSGEAVDIHATTVANSNSGAIGATAQPPSKDRDSKPETDRVPKVGDRDEYELTGSDHSGGSTAKLQGRLIIYYSDDTLNGDKYLVSTNKIVAVQDSEKKTPPVTLLESKDYYKWDADQARYLEFLDQVIQGEKPSTLVVKSEDPVPNSYYVGQRFSYSKTYDDGEVEKTIGQVDSESDTKVKAGNFHTYHLREEMTRGEARVVVEGEYCPSISQFVKMTRDQILADGTQSQSFELVSTNVD